MTSIKGFFLTAVFALLIFCFQNIDGQRCNQKRYYCPNNTVNLDTSNLVILREAQRNLSRNILSSPLLSNLSPKGREFVSYILSRINTDSPSEALGHYTFSIWTMIYLANPYEYTSLCLIATIVNASVNWVTVREQNTVADGLRLLGNSGSFLCTMVQVNALSQLGCENIPPLLPVPSNCYRFGKVYQIEQALDLFGRTLPCYVLEKLYYLYSSTRYSDNVLAAAYIFSLSPLTRTLTAEHNHNLLIETFSMLLFNNVSVCCCAKRNQRFNEMCASHSNVLLQNVNTMINNTIYFDECATEQTY